MSHRVVVSDSSVLVDLERGSFFAAAFALRLEFCVPDLLYRRELEPYGGDRLRAMGLRVLELDDIGVSQAVRYRQAVAALSLSDAFALALAHRTGSTLLTGDACLRRLAIDKKRSSATASSGSSTECFESAQQHRNSCTTALSASVTTRVAGFPSRSQQTPPDFQAGRPRPLIRITAPVDSRDRKAATSAWWRPKDSPQIRSVPVADG